MLVRTAQMSVGKGRYDAIDITAMSGSELFAPTENMVRMFKSGQMSQERFAELYKQKMERSFADNRDIWMQLLEEETVTLVCYCGSYDFCHRFLLAEMMVDIGRSEGYDVQYEGEIL